MFTGIIEEIGTVDAIRKGARSAVLVIHGNKIFSDLKIGDSVATNGVCLTATEITGKTFSADVMNETISRSTLGKLRPGKPCEPGAGDGGRRTFRRTYGGRPCGWHRKDPSYQEG